MKLKNPELYTPKALANFCSKAGRDIQARVMVPKKDGSGKTEAKAQMGKGLYGPEWVKAGLEKRGLKRAVKKGILLMDEAVLRDENEHPHRFKVYYMTHQQISEILKHGEEQQSKGQGAKGAAGPGDKPERELATHSPIIDPRTNRPVRKERFGLLRGNSSPDPSKLEPPVPEENNKQQEVHGPKDGATEEDN